MSKADGVELQLRYRIMGLLHAGRVLPGDRLPSIRSMSRSLGLDHRLIADAYRELERDGVLEIRPSSGIFLAAEGKSGDVPSEQVSWLGRVLHDGWVREIPRGDLGGLMVRATGADLRCALIESNVDHMVAFAAELAEEFSLEPEELMVAPVARAQDLGMDSLEGFDLIVTSVFHAEVVRAVGAELSIPVVVLTANPYFTAELSGLMDRKRMTVVIVDGLYAERAKTFLRLTAYRGRGRFVQVSEVESGDLDLAREDVLVTRAARRALGMADYHLTPPPPGLISSESAHDLLTELTRLSIAATQPRD